MNVENVASQIVERIDPEIDRIEGLITLVARSGRIWGLIESQAYLADVQEELSRLLVPASLLELDVADGDFLIPYPNDDPRLMRWIGQE